MKLFSIVFLGATFGALGIFSSDEAKAAQVDTAYVPNTGIVGPTTVPPQRQQAQLRLNPNKMRVQRRGTVQTRPMQRARRAVTTTHVASQKRELRRGAAGYQAQNKNIRRGIRPNQFLRQKGKCMSTCKQNIINQGLRPTKAHKGQCIQRCGLQAKRSVKRVHTTAKPRVVRRGAPKAITRNMPQNAMPRMVPQKTQRAAEPMIRRTAPQKPLHLKRWHEMTPEDHVALGRKVHQQIGNRHVPPGLSHH